MKEITTIFFDLDGTLVDTLPGICRGVNHTLEELNLPARSYEEVRNFIGDGVEELIARALGNNNEDLVKRAVTIFTDYRHREPDAVGELYPEVKKTLESLGDKRMAIISNGQKKLAERILNVLGIERYFDPVLGGDSPDCRKPSPCPLLNTIEKLGFSPKETLMVGDMTVDLEAGKKAGTLTAAALYGYGDRDELEALDPDYLLEEITDLIGIIGQ